jgi:hypothetical protein
MPKKQLQKRIAACAEEYAEHVLSFADSQRLAAQPNDALFTVDRAGSQTSKRRIAKQVADRKSTSVNSIVSLTERKLVERAVAKLKHQQEHTSVSATNTMTTVAAAAAAAAATTRTHPLNDLWGEDVMAVDVSSSSSNSSSSRSSGRKRGAPAGTAPGPRTKKVTPAIGGQSYNPSVEDHQDALAEALALEIKKREEERSTKGPIDVTLSALTQSVLVTDDSDDDDNNNNNNGGGGGIDDDDEDREDKEGSADSVKATKQRVPEKLSKAQRNKIKARKVAEFESAQERVEKAILKSIDDSAAILKSLDDEEKRRADAKAFRAAQRKDALEAGALTREESVLVPLSDELRGSLRTLLPKGCAVKDQARAMRSNGDLMAQDRRKRKSTEKPHGSKRIKWHAKYKY